MQATVVLDREARALVRRLQTWTPARYAAHVDHGPGDHGTPGSRGDLVHHLAQAFATATARLEGDEPRELPRLDSDLGLADQLAVTADDLVRAHVAVALEPDAAGHTAHLLLHRTHLLGDEVPPGLAVSLGLDDLVAAGRTVCARTDLA